MTWSSRFGLIVMETCHTHIGACCHHCAGNEEIGAVYIYG